MNTISTITLACGMPLLVEPMSGVRSVGLTWLLPAGVATEPPDRRGLTPVLAEMAMRGAGMLDSRAQADAFDKLGVNRGLEPGGVYLRLTATLTGDRLNDALPLFADIVRRPMLGADALEPARELALQSLAGVKDNPQERVAIALSEAFNPLPLERCTHGTEAGLAAITRDDVLKAWSERVRPRGAILAIAGAVDAAATAARLDELLKGWEGSAPLPALAPNALAGTMRHIEDGTSQVQVMVAHAAPREADGDSIHEKMAAAVLSGGSSARLFTEVREKRALCYSVSAGYGPDREFGRVVAYVGTTPDKAQESLDVLVAELKRLRTPAGAATAEEFARAVVRAKTGLVFSGESTSARAGSLAGDFHRLGRGRSLAEMAAQVDGATLKGLNEYLARAPMGRLTVVTLGPKGLKAVEG
ncbi:MAG: M16 family metallopeptidase [Phycisphaerales bacterium]